MLTRGRSRDRDPGLIDAYAEIPQQRLGELELEDVLPERILDEGARGELALLQLVADRRLPAAGKLLLDARLERVDVAAFYVQQDVLLRIAWDWESAGRRSAGRDARP